jgi:molybdenum cofactor cytidylyltransferase
MNIDGVILAAGFSRRVGAQKMLLNFEGKKVIERCIEGMYDCCSKIIVVGGYKIENLQPICNNNHKVTLIKNEDFESGMFSSVRAGIKFVKAARFFLTPGDYPLIQKNTYCKMKNTKGDLIIPEFEGQSGHPVLIKSIFIDEILHSTFYSNLRDFINARKVTLCNVSDPGILWDIDNMSDYNKLIKYYRKKRNSKGV